FCALPNIAEFYEFRETLCSRLSTENYNDFKTETLQFLSDIQERYGKAFIIKPMEILAAFNSRISQLQHTLQSEEAHEEHIFLALNLEQSYKNIEDAIQLHGSI
ncbi:hypothetical protein, partial [Facilibium subflavum]|uniref:hypothetical protein n=1 Tax=Facilibium subflavum TaxID=2219058 RepID=UPI0013C2BCA3